MPESQDDIDALLAEVNALADEAIVDVAASEQGSGAGLPAGEPLVSIGSSTSAATVAAPARGRPSDPPARTAGATTPPAAHSQRDPSRILRLEVPVIVQLAARTMPLSDILGLSTGAIIEFDKPSDGELELMINNKCIGHGQAVKVGENFGLRVSTVGSVRDRIHAMGG